MSLKIAGYNPALVASALPSASPQFGNPAQASPTDASVGPASISPASAPPAGPQDILHDFLLQNPEVKETSSGNEFIIVDSHTADFSDKDFNQQTLHMADGSSLTLIGIIHPQHMAAA